MKRGKVRCYDVYVQTIVKKSYTIIFLQIRCFSCTVVMLLIKNGVCVQKEILVPKNCTSYDISEVKMFTESGYTHVNACIVKDLVNSSML